MKKIAMVMILRRLRLEQAVWMRESGGAMGSQGSQGVAISGSVVISGLARPITTRSIANVADINSGIGTGKPLVQSDMRQLERELLRQLPKSDDVIKEMPLPPTTAQRKFDFSI